MENIGYFILVQIWFFIYIINKYEQILWGVWDTLILIVLSRWSIFSNVIDTTYGFPYRNRVYICHFYDFNAFDTFWNILISLKIQKNIYVRIGKTLKMFLWGKELQTLSQHGKCSLWCDLMDLFQYFLNYLVYKYLKKNV